ncbi:MAG: tyrosine-type recombinase/integrase [Clostridiaceae bacterium]|nr:tyrosine-type recombinase/integrase [Clostridiaceae bacterium]
MGQIFTKPFEVKLQKENEYLRLHVTHPKFKGRIRKRLGDRDVQDLESIAFNLKYELGKQFNGSEINKSEVEAFIDNFVAMNVKGTASIFDYKEDFLRKLSEKFNKKTKKHLSKSTLSAYRTSLKYFEEFIRKRKIPAHPSQITESVLNDFYTHIPGKHNYKVKLHTKLKGFIKYLDEARRLPVDPSYKLSKFTEEYDNQCPEDDDIALPVDAVLKLFELRKKLQTGEVQIQKFAKSDKISVGLQDHLFNMKKENLIKCLDCFLFMVSTGQYFADIRKSILYFSENDGFPTIKYRRAKNGSLCRTIPINNDGIFISEEIMEQYNIINGTNFPIKLSLTHFDKHLGRISQLANIGFKITNKMARKTFASYLYYNKKLPMQYLQNLLGHMDVKDTMHYLRIADYDSINELKRYFK